VEDPTRVFVCGVPRSGTTLLMRLLDGHPALAVLPWDTQVRELLLRRATVRAAVRVSAVLDLRELPAMLARMPLRAWAEPDRDVLADRLRRWLHDLPHPPQGGERLALEAAAEAPGLRGVWEAFFILLARIEGQGLLARPVRVEKTPYNETLVPLFDALFGENTRFVHLVRDPRAVIGSWMRAHAPGQPARGRALVDRCLDWARSIDLCRHHLTVRRGRYLAVRYEDLVHDPGAAMERVRRFLGIGSDAAFLTPTHLGSPAASNSSFGPGSEPGIVVRETDRYGEALRDEEIADTECWLAPQMRACGYPAIHRGEWEGGPRRSPASTGRGFRGVWKRYELGRRRRHLGGWTLSAADPT
jgi:hypothetical protein